MYRVQSRVSVEQYLPRKVAQNPYLNRTIRILILDGIDRIRYCFEDWSQTLLSRQRHIADSSFKVDLHHWER